MKRLHYRTVSTKQPVLVSTMCRAKLHHNAAAVHVPLGLEGGHEGVIDVVSNKAFTFGGDFG